MTEEMRRWLNRTDEESGRKNGEIFIENVMIAASEGNAALANHVFDRLEGPVRKTSEIDVTSAGKPLGEMSADEIERKALEILSRRAQDT